MEDDEEAARRLRAVEQLWSFCEHADISVRFQTSYRVLGRPASLDDLDRNASARIEEVQAAVAGLDLADPEVKARVSGILTRIGRCHELLTSGFRLQAPPEPPAEAPANPDSKASVRTFLLDRLYDQLVLRRTKIINDQLYVARKTAEGRETLFWVRLCDVPTFVYRTFDKYRRPDDYASFTGHGGEALNLHVHVQKSLDDTRMPRLKKNRHVFSFENGVYVAHLVPEMLADPDAPNEGLRHGFFSYDGEHRRLKGDIAAAQHFEGLDFDVEQFREVVENAAWRQVPTPTLDSIFHHQEIAGEAYDWALFFLGRLLYDVNETDRLQLIPYILGVAGSGKSTILQYVVGRFYMPEDIGIMGNTSEKNFGVWPLLDKLLFYCAEVKDDFEVNQSMFQQMVAGENVTVAVKHQMARSGPWTSPGILAGNDVFGYRDSSGSLMRRVVMLDFKNHVGQRDPGLPVKLKAELPNIILKVNSAYHWGIATLDGRDFWSLNVEYFKGTSKAFSSRVDALRALFEDQDNDAVVIAPRNALVFCPINVVVKKLREARNNNMNAKAVRDHAIFSGGNRDFLIYDTGARTITYPRAGYNRHPKRGAFVFGFDVRYDGLDINGMPGDAPLDPDIQEEVQAAFG